MVNEYELYSCAINGTNMYGELCKYLPKKYCLYSDNGDMLYKFNLSVCISDFNNRLKTEQTNEKLVSFLKAVFGLIQFTPKVLDMYENFDPRCEEEKIYDKCKQKYVDEQLEKQVLTSKNFADAWAESMSNEFTSIIDFGILHKLGCMYEEVKDALVKRELLDEQCFISQKTMEERSEKNKEDKFFEIIDFLEK